jgi:S1/P1 Nuclease
MSILDPFEGCDEACRADHADDGRNMSIAEGCIWADESRRDTFKHTYEYHDINVPKAETTFDFDRDCAALDCAIVGIQRFATYLADPNAGTRARCV